MLTPTTPPSATATPIPAPSPTAIATVVPLTGDTGMPRGDDVHVTLAWVGIVGMVLVIAGTVLFWCEGEDRRKR